MAKAKKINQNTKEQYPLIFNRNNYLWMLIGLVLILLGLGLMSGGAMPSSDTWDESVIYSTRRTLLAPFIILVGFALEVYAIFKR